MNRKIVRRLVMAAYDRGWSDANFDHMVQRNDPNHPLGDSKVREADPLVEHLDPFDLLGLRGRDAV